MGWLGIPGGVYESRKRDVQTGSPQAPSSRDGHAGTFSRGRLPLTVVNWGSIERVISRF
jgi:hypothetical protein